MIPFKEVEVFVVIKDNTLCRKRFCGGPLNILLRQSDRWLLKQF